MSVPSDAQPEALSLSHSGGRTPGQLDDTFRPSWPNNDFLIKVEKGQRPAHMDAGAAGAAGTGVWGHPREFPIGGVNGTLRPTVFPVAATAAAAALL